MSDDGFDLFYAKERARQAELAHKDMEDALSRTKARATSLLGWAITLTTASVGAALATQPGQHDRQVEAMVSAAGFFLTSVLCAKVLYSTKIMPLAQPPARFDGIMRDDDENTEAGFYRAFSEFADEIDTRNYEAVAKDQRTMRLAWVVGCATPVAVSFAALGFWLAGHCRAL